MLTEDIRHLEKQIIGFKNKYEKKIKDEKGDKGGREGALSQEGNQEERFPKTRKHSLLSLW